MNAHITYVYFIYAANSRLVKIGSSADPWKRFVQLQFLSPETLEMVGLVRASRDYEAHLHSIFGRRRHHGEWFEVNRDLRDLILSLEPPIPGQGRPEMPLARHDKPSPRRDTMWPAAFAADEDVDTGEYDKPGALTHEGARMRLRRDQRKRLSKEVWAAMERPPGAGAVNGRPLDYLEAKALREGQTASRTRKKTAARI